MFAFTFVDASKISAYEFLLGHFENFIPSLNTNEELKVQNSKA